MKILITGANGQLGSELQRVLRAGRSELGPIPPLLTGAVVAAADLPEVDIADQQRLQEQVRRAGPSVIINCAAYTDVNACESEQDTAFRANALGARNVAVAAEMAGAKLIHISTDYVFPGNGSTPYNEWDLCAPQSVYGHTKYLGEQYVRDFCSRYFIVRTSWLYGYTGGNFVKTILGAARKNGALQVVNDQFGNPTNAADLAHHLLKLAVTEDYGIYHCTGSGECSWYQFACEFIRLSGLPCTLTPCTTDQYPTPARRPAHSSLENRMLRCTVGDEMRPWKDAITAYMQHYNKDTGEILV